MAAVSTPDVIVAVIAGMAVANFSLRFVPLALFSRIALPRPIMRWLEFIPISVMGALFAKEVLLPSASGYSSPFAAPGLYGALAAMVAFRFTRSFLGGTLGGVVTYLVLRWAFSALGIA